MVFLFAFFAACTTGAALIDGPREHKKSRARMKAWQKKSFGGRHG